VGRSFMPHLLQHFLASSTPAGHVWEPSRMDICSRDQQQAGNGCHCSRDLTGKGVQQSPTLSGWVFKLLLQGRVWGCLLRRGGQEGPAASWCCHCSSPKPCWVPMSYAACVCGGGGAKGGKREGSTVKGSTAYDACLERLQGRGGG
jgi:hypothetical protein